MLVEHLTVTFTTHIVLSLVILLVNYCPLHPMVLPLACCANYILEKGVVNTREFVSSWCHDWWCVMLLSWCKWFLSLLSWTSFLPWLGYWLPHNSLNGLSGGQLLTSLESGLHFYSLYNYSNWNCMLEDVRKMYLTFSLNNWSR